MINARLFDIYGTAQRCNSGRRKSNCKDVRVLAIQSPNSSDPKLSDNLAYSFQKSGVNFDVRYHVLSSFRDRVLNRVFSSYYECSPLFHPMIIYISFTTADRSPAYEKFCKIADIILGSDATAEQLQYISQVATLTLLFTIKFTHRDNVNNLDL